MFTVFDNYHFGWMGYYSPACKNSTVVNVSYNLIELELPVNAAEFVELLEDKVFKNSALLYLLYLFLVLVTVGLFVALCVEKSGNSTLRKLFSCRWWRSKISETCEIRLDGQGQRQQQETVSKSSCENPVVGRKGGVSH